MNTKTKPIVDLEARAACIAATIDNAKSYVIPARAMKDRSWACIRQAAQTGGWEIQAHADGNVRCYRDNVLADEHIDAALALRVRR